MFSILIADLKIAIDNKYSFIEKLCEPYKYRGADYDFCVAVNDDELEKERALSNAPFAYEQIESICIYRNIAEQLPYFNAFVMHCAAVKYDEHAYCFAAKSGTGKTTHIKLWRALLGDKVGIINGDKPIMRFTDGIFRVYGTPWAGKENYNRNTSAPIGGICFLKQASENAITRISSHDALNKLLQQIYIPKNPDNLLKTIDLINKLLMQTSTWQLDCNVSKEAAMLSLSAMCIKE